MQQMQGMDYAAEECLQRIQKKRHWVPWDMGCIVQKREELKQLCLAGQQGVTENKQELNCKKELYKLYSQGKHWYNKVRIRKVESAQKEQQGKKAWRVVNEINARKGTKKAVKANNTTEKIQEWKEDFSNLGKPPQIIEADIIPKIEGELPINTGIWTWSAQRMPEVNEKQ